jgi:hypothetical protein
MSTRWNISLHTVTGGFLDLSRKEEVRCDCGRPLTVTPLTDDTARFNECRCGRQEKYVLPDCELFGPEDGPWLLYVPKITQSIAGRL